MEVLDGGLGGSKELVLVGVNAQFTQVVDIVGEVPGGIISEERVTHADLLEQREEGNRDIEERASLIDGTIHVEGDMADAF